MSTEAQAAANKAVSFDCSARPESKERVADYAEK